MPLRPGPYFLENYRQTLFEGTARSSRSPVGLMMLNSLVMALTIAIGKIAISIISAFAIVYFRFPFRMTAFWVIFVTADAPRRGAHLPDLQDRRRSRPARQLYGPHRAAHRLGDGDLLLFRSSS